LIRLEIKANKYYSVLITALVATNEKRRKERIH
jgi:hypothetical protein